MGHHQAAWGNADALERQGKTRQSSPKSLLVYATELSRQARSHQNLAIHLRSACHLNPETTPAVPAVVLDTNAVLDATLFADPAMAPWAAAITSGRLRWLATAAMRLELQRVLDGRLLAPRLAVQDEQRHAALDWFDRWAQLQAEAPASLAPRLRCSDPDDQVFIELALQCGARYLVSQDRAVLKLARKARAFGLQVLRPRDGQPP
jgi:predicted nucleic acid-binding protein